MTSLISNITTLSLAHAVVGGYASLIKHYIMPSPKISKKKFTPGLAPSVINMSSALAGKPSRAAIPAAIASRKPLIPWQQRKGNRPFHIRE